MHPLVPSNLLLNICNGVSFAFTCCVQSSGFGYDTHLHVHLIFFFLYSSVVIWYSVRFVGSCVLVGARDGVADGLHQFTYSDLPH